jgi:hypothetical protein
VILARETQKLGDLVREHVYFYDHDVHSQSSFLPGPSAASAEHAR